jgi:hypothetical protein
MLTGIGCCQLLRRIESQMHRNPCVQCRLYQTHAFKHKTPLAVALSTVSA